MKRLTRTLPLLLAAALQLLPLLRNIVTIPTASSSFAIILRWGIGGAATVGAYDACSGATPGGGSPPVYVTPTNFFGTVGIYFTNNITVTNVGGDPGAYFNLINSNFTVSATFISNNVVTTNCLPAGLSFKCYDKNNSTPPYMLGAIYGTPTSPVTNLFIHIQAGYKSYAAIETTNYFTIYPASSSSPPIITNQPVIGATNLVGTTNNLFSVTAGTAPLNYQWYFNTNTAVIGATNATLTLNNIQLTNAGFYRCTITNSAGTTNSSNALLTVWQPPIMTNQPASITNVAGGNGTFSVTAVGVPAMTYQWKFNTNTTLLNATNTSLTLTGLRASQAGVYTVVVTNSAGSVTSSIANLVITNPNPPTMTSPVKSGSLFQFTFLPVVGLTNSVLTNSVITGGSWGVLTNVPPPSTTSPITVTDPFSKTNRFYRVQIVP